MNITLPVQLAARSREAQSPTTGNGGIGARAASVACAAAVALGLHAAPHTVSPLWRADAICETGWSPPDWRYGAPGHHGAGSGYEGGIGFAPSTWRWWSGHVRAARRFAHAYDAPPWVQAAVAEYGLDHYGRWGCLYHPEVWRWR